MTEPQTRALDHKKSKEMNIGQWLRAPAVTRQIKRLNPNADVERIFVLAMSQVKDNDKLMACTPQSIVRAVATCATLGLEPDKVSQHAHLVPYAGVCTLIPGYKGLKKLAEQHPDVAHIEPPRVVYMNDEFELEYGLSPKVRHVPELDRDPGEVRGCYVIARLTNGDDHVEWMNRRDLDKVKTAALGNKKRSDSPWLSHTEEMYRKTLIRRVCKHLPQSSILAKAVTLDEQAEEGVAQDLDIIDMEVTGSKPKTNGKPGSLDDVVDQAEQKQLPVEPAAGQSAVEGTPPSAGGDAPINDQPPAEPTPNAKQPAKGEQKKANKKAEKPGKQSSLPLEAPPIQNGAKPEPEPETPAEADEFTARFNQLDTGIKAELLDIYGLGTIKQIGTLNQKMQDDLRADTEKALGGA